MENKIKRGINIIDILIVLAITAVCAIGFIILKPGTTISGTTPLTYVIEFERQKDGFEENIIVGEKLYDNLKGYEIGTIKSVSVEPFTISTPDYDNNQIVMAPVDGYNSIYLEVLADSTVTDENIKIGDYEVYIGSYVYVKSKGFASGGIVVNMNY